MIRLTKSNMHDKNKGQIILNDRGDVFKYILFHSNARDYLGSSQKSMAFAKIVNSLLFLQKKRHHKRSTGL